MKRNFTRIMAALALLVFMMPSMVAWGQTYTLVESLNSLSQGTYCIAALNNGTYYTVPNTTINGQTFTCTEATFSNNVLTPAENHGQFVFTSVTGVNNAFYIYNTSLGKYLVATGSKKFGYVDNTSTDYGYWTFSTVSSGGFSGAFSVQHSEKTQYMRAYSNSVRCYDGTSNNGVYLFVQNVTNDPSISASAVDIAYNVTSGEIEYTINNPISGGVLTATTTADWLSLGTVGTTVPFTCSANSGAERTATVVLTYTYNTDQTITKNVTVTQAGNPNVVNNISDITTAGTYTVKGTIVAKSTRGFIVGDGTGYIYYYNTSYDQNAYAIGNMVKLSGAVSAYGSVFQYTSTATVTEASESNYQTEEPLFITGSAMQTRVGSTDNTLSSYIQYEGTLSVSGTYYNITGIDGATTAQGSISYPINTDFTSLNGKTVTVTGYFVGVSSSKYYNTMLGSIEEVVSNEPSITVEPATINAPFAGAEGTLTVTYENITIVAADVYFCNAAGTEATYDWVTASVNETTNNVDYLIEENEGEARTAYLKVWAYDDDLNEVYSDIVTINQAEYVAPTYAELPFEFNGGKAAIEETDGLYQEGLGSDYSSEPKLKFNDTGDWLLLQFNERPGTLTFDIKGNSFNGSIFKVQTSVDGNSYNDLKTYNDFGTSGNDLKEEETFTDLGENVRYIKWVYTEKVQNGGNVGLGNIVLAKYEAPVPAITVESTTITATAAETEGTLNVTYTAIESYDINWYESDGTTAVTEPEWVSTDFDAEGNVTYLIEENTDGARTAYFKVYGVDADLNDVYSELVTIRQAASAGHVATGNNYELYSGSLVEGDYLIVYNGKAMNNVVDKNRLQYVNVTPNNNNVIVLENAEAIWHIAPNGDYWTIYSANADAYAASTGTKNQAQMLDDGTDDMALWTVSGTATYEFVNKNNDESNVNANLRNNGEYGFACYATSTGGALSLYKRNDNYTPAIAIKGYGEGDGGYVLVASPFSTTPVAAGMITESNYDLYYYDDTQELEWINYKNEDGTVNSSFGNLTPGTGYLYANKNDVTLSFAGTAYTGDGQVPVIAGNNLVGNPYDVAANLSVPYYRLNAAGSELNASTETSAVNAMEGVFVNAEQAGSVSFTTSNSGNGKSNAVVMNLSRNRGTVIDNAIVRFDNGRQLPKFQLFENNTKLYIPQGNKDFAIVRSAAQGEMPVSFRASENGTYTIAVEAENVDMNYLHLIDNMTGADVDLLATPNYTFEARTNDYTSRFRLVFSANGIDEQTAETFAFFNGTSWTVSNTGDATLQVVDITGRIVSSETINGNATISLNQPAGIYMLRLVNGNDVKVQKVVVR